MADSSHENAGAHVVEANLDHIQTKSNLDQNKNLFKILSYFYTE